MVSTNEERKFVGFSRETLKFLRGLKANNETEWFKAHKADYEEYETQQSGRLL